MGGLNFDDLLPPPKATRALAPLPGEDPFAGMKPPTAADVASAWKNHRPMAGPAPQAQAAPGAGMQFDELIREPKMGAGEDAARSIAPGAVKGVTGIIGGPGDLIDLAGNAGMRGINAVGNFFTGNDTPDPEPFPFHSLATAFNPHMGGTGPMFPTSGEMNQAVQGVTGPYHQPQTWAGRLTDTAGQMLPAALLPGGPLARAARVLVPTATSDIAGETARKVAPNNPQAEAWARALGAVGGGLGEGFGESVVNAPKAALAKALDGVEAPDIADMQARMQQAKSQGIALTPAEALTQGGKGTLNRVLHYVESSPTGGPITAPFFAQRPAQVSGAINTMADALAPARPDPSMLGVETQGAANGALKNVRQAINDVAQPHYDALKTQEMDPATFAQLQENPSFKGALADWRANPELSGAYTHLPDNNLSVLNEVQKRLRSLARSASPGEFNPNGDATLQGLREGAGAQLNSAASDASPDWRAARDTVAAGRQSYLAPLQAGPLGTIAAGKTAPSVPTITSALFRPENVGGASETVDAMGHLAGQNPNLPPQIVAQYLRNSAEATNGALRDLQPGANQWGGAKFVTQVAAAPEQRAALLGGTAAAAGDERAQQLADLLDTLQATGKRMPAGSLTNSNAEYAKALGVNPLSKITSIIDPLEWGQHIDRAVGGAMYRRNVTTLADVLTRMKPEDAAAYLLKAKGMGGGGNGLATALVAGSAGANQ